MLVVAANVPVSTKVVCVVKTVSVVVAMILTAGELSSTNSSSLRALDRDDERLWRKTMENQSHKSSFMLGFR